MFNPSFQLPIQKATELFPSTSAGPPVIHISVQITQNKLGVLQQLQQVQTALSSTVEQSIQLNQDGTAHEDDGSLPITSFVDLKRTYDETLQAETSSAAVQTQAIEVITRYRGQLLGFLHSQRHNHSLGVTENSRTSFNFGAVHGHLTTLQGQETLDATILLDWDLSQSIKLANQIIEQLNRVALNIFQPGKSDITKLDFFNDIYMVRGKMGGANGQRYTVDNVTDAGQYWIKGSGIDVSTTDSWPRADPFQTDFVPYPINIIGDALLELGRMDNIIVIEMDFQAPIGTYNGYISDYPRNFNLSPAKLTGYNPELILDSHYNDDVFDHTTPRVWIAQQVEYPGPMSPNFVSLVPQSFEGDSIDPLTGLPLPTRYPGFDDPSITDLYDTDYGLAQWLPSVDGPTMITPAKNGAYLLDYRQDDVTQPAMVRIAPPGGDYNGVPFGASGIRVDHGICRMGMVVATDSSAFTISGGTPVLSSGTAPDTYPRSGKPTYTFTFSVKAIIRCIWCVRRAKGQNTAAMIKNLPSFTTVRPLKRWNSKTPLAALF